jgi:hypothetical protein
VFSVIIEILFEFNENFDFCIPCVAGRSEYSPSLHLCRSRCFSLGRSGLHFSRGFCFLAASCTGQVLLSCSRFLSPMALSQREASVLSSSVFRSRGIMPGLPVSA